jgi:transposase
MGRAHSSDLRDRVYTAVAEGGSRHAAARRFGVSVATAVRLAQRQAQTGSLAPARQGRPAGSGKLAAYREVVIGWVKADGER